MKILETKTYRTITYELSHDDRHGYLLAIYRRGLPEFASFRTLEEAKEAFDKCPGKIYQEVKE